MIQNDKIIGLIKGTIPYTNRTLSDLSDLIEEYPYFQTAHLLYTLNLLNLKDPDFLFDLRMTAIYLQYRKQLLFLTENNFFDPELMEIMEAAEISDKETLPSEPDFELIDAFLSENAEEAELDDIVLESQPVSQDYTAFVSAGETETEEAPPLEHQDVIDKFLEEDAISPVKIKLEKPDKPAPDVELPEEPEEPVISIGFFSETLAKIYIKQKKYTKALEILNKLNLLYPKKSRYFADQIRFLELVINTNRTK